MAEPKKPQRRFHLTIDIQADDEKSLYYAINSIAHMVEHEKSHNVVSGGYDSGYYFTLTEYPEQTHDRYVEENNAWLKWNRRENADA